MERFAKFILIFLYIVKLIEAGPTVDPSVNTENIDDDAKSKGYNNSDTLQVYGKNTNDASTPPLAVYEDQLLHTKLSEVLLALRKCNDDSPAGERDKRFGNCIRQSTELLKRTVKEISNHKQCAHDKENNRKAIISRSESNLKEKSAPPMDTNDSLNSAKTTDTVLNSAASASSIQSTEEPCEQPQLLQKLTSADKSEKSTTETTSIIRSDAETVRNERGNEEFATFMNAPSNDKSILVENRQGPFDETDLNIPIKEIENDNNVRPRKIDSEGDPEKEEFYIVKGTTNNSLTRNNTEHGRAIITDIDDDVAYTTVSAIVPYSSSNRARNNDAADEEIKSHLSSERNGQKNENRNNRNGLNVSADEHYMNDTDRAGTVENKTALVQTAGASDNKSTTSDAGRQQIEKERSPADKNLDATAILSSDTLTHSAEKSKDHNNNGTLTDNYKITTESGNSELPAAATSKSAESTSRYFEKSADLVNNHRVNTDEEKPAKTRVNISTMSSNISTEYRHDDQPKSTAKILTGTTSNEMPELTAEQTDVTTNSREFNATASTTPSDTLFEHYLKNNDTASEDKTKPTSDSRTRSRLHEFGINVTTEHYSREDYSVMMISTGNREDVVMESAKSLISESNVDKHQQNGNTSARDSSVMPLNVTAEHHREEAKNATEKLTGTESSTNKSESTVQQTNGTREFDTIISTEPSDTSLEHYSENKGAASKGRTESTSIKSSESAVRNDNQTKSSVHDFDTTTSVMTSDTSFEHHSETENRNKATLKEDDYETATASTSVKLTESSTDKNVQTPDKLNIRNVTLKDDYKTSIEFNASGIYQYEQTKSISKLADNHQEGNHEKTFTTPEPFKHYTATTPLAVISESSNDGDSSIIPSSTAATTKYLEEEKIPVSRINFGNFSIEEKNATSCSPFFPLKSTEIQTSENARNSNQLDDRNKYDRQNYNDNRELSISQNFGNNTLEDISSPSPDNVSEIESLTSINNNYKTEELPMKIVEKLDQAALSHDGSLEKLNKSTPYNDTEKSARTAFDPSSVQFIDFSQLPVLSQERNPKYITAQSRPQTNDNTDESSNKNIDGIRTTALSNGTVRTSTDATIDSKIFKVTGESATSSTPLIYVSVEPDVTQSVTNNNNSPVKPTSSSTDNGNRDFISSNSDLKHVINGPTNAQNTVRNDSLTRSTESPDNGSSTKSYFSPFPIPHNSGIPPAAPNRIVIADNNKFPSLYVQRVTNAPTRSTTSSDIISITDNEKDKNYRGNITEPSSSKVIANGLGTILTSTDDQNCTEEEEHKTLLPSRNSSNSIFNAANTNDNVLTYTTVPVHIHNSSPSFIQPNNLHVLPLFTTMISPDQQQFSYTTTIPNVSYQPTDGIFINGAPPSILHSTTTIVDGSSRPTYLYTVQHRLHPNYYHQQVRNTKETTSKRKLQDDEILKLLKEILKRYHKSDI